MQPLHDKCFTKEHVLAKQQELQVPDKLLLEKAIRAMALLGALAAIMPTGQEIIQYLENLPE